MQRTTQIHSTNAAPRQSLAPKESAELKKELGLRDLALTQILVVVGSAWVGTAAKLGPSHTIFWLLAIFLFYVPQGLVVIYLNRLMPVEGGLYQWAKLGFNPFAGYLVGWNLWLYTIFLVSQLGSDSSNQSRVRDRPERRVDRRQQAVHHRHHRGRHALARGDHDPRAERG